MGTIILHLKQRPHFILGIIVLFAALLRFYAISTVPVSLYWDETASTYNAYSIAMTGKDEYGTSFPLLFRSFDDYKASGNIYLTSVVVRVFGLNEFSARFTSAFAGTLTVLFTFFLVKEFILLFGKNELIVFKKKIPISIETLGLLTAFLFAISPWSLQFSRAGFEATVAVMFTVCAVWLLLRSLRLDKKWNYFLAMAIFAINFYFYRSIWVFLSLFLICLFFFLRKELGHKKRVKTTLVGIVLFILLLAPFIPTMLSPQGLIRSSESSVFTNSDDLLIHAAQLRLKGGINKIIYNQRLIYPEIIIENYLANLSPQFLFISGDPNGRHSPRGMGVLYDWELPFLLFGIYILIKKISGPIRNIIIAWVLIAPIASAISTPNPHALRSLNMLPMPQVLTAIGLYVVFYLVTKKWRALYIIFSGIVIVLFFIFYMYLYYVISPQRTTTDWADGYKQLTEYMIPRESQYDKLVVTGHYWKPYVYFLFYRAYSPAQFQAEHGNEFHFGKYVFTGTSWGGQQELDHRNIQQFAGAKHILVAMSPSEWQTQKTNVHYLTTIKDHYNKTVFIVGDMK